MNVRSLLFELRRRRVWRVAGAYVVVGWMAVEIGITTIEVLALPSWAATLLVVLAFLGFPVAIVLSWAFDLTPRGVVRTPAADAVQVAVPPAAGSRVTTPARLAGVMGVGILVALVGFGAYARYGPAAAGPQPAERIESVAVLPFVDLSAAGDQGYFSDGVTEELMNRLAQVEGLRVAARTSAFAFREAELGVSEIARRLQVDAVLEGSVRREGDRVRVSAQLVDAATGYQLWSQSYDREAEGIFAIQDEISTAIVDALRLQLAAEDGAAGTASVRAHDFYLLGLARLHARTEADLLRGLEYFERAVGEDPDYALAHAGLALTYAALPAVGRFPAAEAFDQGMTAAARALALDARLPEAHAAMGQLAQGFDWDLDRAERAYRRSVEFQSNYATGHQLYAEVLLIQGRLEEAAREIERALELDPLSPSAQHVAAYLSLVQQKRGDAARRFRLLTQQHPDFTPGTAGLVFFCVLDGRHDEAIEALPAAVGGGETAALLEPVLRGIADAGRREAAVAALGALRGRIPPMQLALWHAAVGDDEGAIVLVEQAFADRADPNLPLLLIHPLFDGLRQRSTFRMVMQAVGAEAPMARLAAG